jgi:DNA replicative helicase MCM subunit Mcm2 (Cdc46/Mcm family)
VSCDKIFVTDTSPAPEGQKKDCPLDPYVILHDRCRFMDQQMIKLQEAPDMVPVGELPRHMMMQAERYLTGKVVPGSRIITTGIYSTFAPSGKNVGHRYKSRLTHAEERHSRASSALPPRARH